MCSEGAAPAFDVASLAQSHPEPNALNTITVTLRSTAGMGKESAIHGIIISGLHGAILPAGEIELEDAFGGPGTFGPSIFCSFPVWHDVCPGVAVKCGGEIRFSFSVRNPESQQAAPDIYVEAYSASAETVIGRTEMDGPSGHATLIGVPLGWKALHIAEISIPQGVAVAAPGDAGALSGTSTEVWLRPGWYKEAACNLVFERSVTILGSSSDANDIVLDCKGIHRHMHFTGRHTVGTISNVRQ
jgi:hypothetical protein